MKVKDIFEMNFQEEKVPTYTPFENFDNGNCSLREHNKQVDKNSIPNIIDFFILKLIFKNFSDFINSTCNVCNRITLSFGEHASSNHHFFKLT